MSTEDDLRVALEALARISDPAESSLRFRDANCVRYVASNALALLERRGRRSPFSWVRYRVFTRVSGDQAADVERRGSA